MKGGNMTHTYVPKGICPRKIEITMNPETNCIETVQFDGGCPGNALGIGVLVKNKKPEEIIAQLEGLPCGNKKSSCPDQLALALKEILEHEQV